MLEKTADDNLITTFIQKQQTIFFHLDSTRDSKNYGSGAIHKNR